MRYHIRHAGGNEVFFIGKSNKKSIVENAQVVARGNKHMVPAITNIVHTGDIVIHNHPSGNLEPSDADTSIASMLGNEGVAFYIINNSVSNIYIVVELQRPQQTIKLIPEKLLATLNADGPLAQLLENYEERPPQQMMLKKVIEAFNEDKIATIEAGTGTGKTMAYLLPAVEWSVRNRERTVIATGTINLQEQVIRKDIPLLQKALDLKFRAALIKGRTNYACKRKLSEAQPQLSLFTDEQHRQDFEAVIAWAKTTSDGSKSDLGFVPNENVWEKIQSESDTTLRAKCPFYNECFFYNARRNAATADVLIANHHILFSDLAVRGEKGGSSEVAVLPKYSRIILDEAHAIEDVASSHFGIALSYHGILRILHRLYRIKDDSETGLLPFAMAKMQKQSHKLTRELLEKLRKQIEIICQPAIGNLEIQLAQVMEHLYTWGISISKDQYKETKIRITPELARDNFYKQLLSTHCVPLIKILRQCVEGFRPLLKLLDDAEGYIGIEAAALVVDIQAQGNRLDEIAEKIEVVLLNDNDNLVSWLELRDSRFGHLVRLYSAPLDVSEMMQQRVFKAFPTVVMTSATLSVGKSFDFFEKNLGIKKIEEKRRSNVQLDSYFDYDKQVLIAIPTDIPEPNQPQFPQALEEGLSQVLKISQGRAFVLFTAYGLLNKMYDALAPQLTKMGIALLKQGKENRHRLIERFKNNIGSVLFGTDSFWQGVDVHGEALQCVIIPRLPFRVPSEPLIAARIEAIDSKGGNSFMEYSVPHAVIKFKQGFGRLIRRKTDYGVIVLFDRRVATKYYGRLFLESLPECRVIKEKSGNIFNQIEEFYRRHRE